MLQESIVDLGDLKRVVKAYVIQHRGGSKLRGSEEAEINAATLISAEWFDCAPLQA